MHNKPTTVKEKKIIKNGCQFYRGLFSLSEGFVAVGGGGGPFLWRSWMWSRSITSRSSATHSNTKNLLSFYIGGRDDNNEQGRKWPSI